MIKALMLLAFALAAQAQNVLPFGGSIAHIADGGGIQTAITITNLEDVSATYTLYFVSNSGTALPLPTSAGTGSVFSGTLQSRASRTITTAGIGAVQQEGWVRLESASVIGGHALYRVSVAPWIGAEATLPIDTGAGNHFVLNFDQTGQAANGIALANPSTYASTTVFLSIKDDRGVQFVLDSITLGPLAHRSFVLASRYPQTVGKTGIVEMTGSGMLLNVLGLRFSGASIASILPLAHWLW